VLRAVGGLVLAGLLLTACGGGGRDQATPASAPTTVPTAAPTTALPTTTTTAPPRVDRRTGVGVRQETFVDPSRSTSGAGAGRTFPTTIWYPTPGDPDAPAVPDAPPDRAVGAYPLVVFVHGYAVTPDFYEELLRRWASAGYVVAAAAYPGADDDYALQFADTTFLITQLLQLSGGAPGSHPLAGTIDPQRVGVAGHSNGEAIAYGLGFLQCCRDPRVKSVIALAGILGNVNNPVQRNNGVPVLHIMGEADELQPYGEAIQWDRDNLTPPRWSVSLVGGSHAPPYRSPSSPYFDGVVTITTDFLDGSLKGHPEKLAAIDDYVAGNANLFRVER
jgi:predicted dienelactone hydrolase